MLSNVQEIGWSLITSLRRAACCRAWDRPQQLQETAMTPEAQRLVRESFATIAARTRVNLAAVLNWWGDITAAGKRWRSMSAVAG